MSGGPLHSVSVSGVTFDGAGQVLLIKRRDNDEWQAPGGILELTERFEDGVVREVFEETGVVVEVEQLTGVYKNMAKGVVALVYRCRAINGSPRTSAESVDVAWVPFNEAMSRMRPAFAIRVRDAVGDRTISASRAHDGIRVFED